jgi:hypothetical protein
MGLWTSRSGGQRRRYMLRTKDVRRSIPRWKTVKDRRSRVGPCVERATEHGEVTSSAPDAHWIGAQFVFDGSKKSPLRRGANGLLEGRQLGARTMSKSTPSAVPGYPVERGDSDADDWLASVRRGRDARSRLRRRDSGGDNRSPTSLIGNRH